MTSEVIRETGNAGEANGPLSTILNHLEALVRCDTQNPPRKLDAESPIFGLLREALPGFHIELFDHGKGRVSFYARRGQPTVLFNVHLDTVPALEGSDHPPLQLIVKNGRAYGRGACDIKGAAACLVTLAAESDAPMALLFTTDEEGGEGCCVQEFVSAGLTQPYEQVVVAEPTQCVAEFRHRGFLSARGHFQGRGGHSSEPRALRENAIHHLARWSSAALTAAQAAEAGGRRTCFNIGTVEGGVKSNVIADHAHIFWSARLSPGDSNEAFLEQAYAWPGGDRADWSVSFSGPPLPTGEHDDRQARSFAERHGLVTGDGLDFWTEASLFGAAGIPALVLGPGNIEQAHVLNEWVALEQLERCLDIYRGIVEREA
ncbi:MAG: acetylornithine deacetylase [Xanthomonadales bacterium]|nr:acetylornithine deacetylase [Xanthomonadales bacterium]